jgi:hypothetical protein
MKAILFVAAALALSCTSAKANFCSEPDPPFCADLYMEFSDQTDFELCKYDMDDYKDEVEEYLDCLSQASEDAIEQYNDAVESFNLRASL